jgi:predicted O-linked N-acetylglucosamine transferase (SPINDLY family)
MDDVTDQLRAALAHQQAGQIADAIATYEGVLARAPDNAAGLHGLGIALLTSGRVEDGAARLARAAELAPRELAIINDLAAAHRLLGRLDEARAGFLRATALEPRYAEGWHNLGMVELARGDPAAACTALERAVALTPDVAFTHLVLGVARTRRGELVPALACFETATRLDPKDARGWVNRALILVELNRARDAAEPATRALELDPDNIDALIARAAAQSDAGEPKAALATLERVLTLKPDHANAWNALSVVLRESGDATGALRAAGRAIELAPGDATPLGNYARAAIEAHRPAEALAYAERAIAIAPSAPSHYFARGRARQEIGDRVGAVADFKRLIELAPCWDAAIDNLAFGLVETPGVDRAREIASTTRRWAETCLPSPRRAHGNSRDRARRIRVGYVSPDFRRHSVAHFFAPTLEAHDPQQVEVHLYAIAKKRDDYTARFQGMVGTRWHDITALDATAAAASIVDHGIDILVDLAGLTEFNRLEIFARKPAPVQVAWLGWPTTTGLAAIDWRLTDAIADPPGAESEYAESLVRLADGFHLWRAPEEAGPVSATVSAPGRVVFGSFNHARKMSSATIALWSRVMTAVPGARLLMKCGTLAVPEFRQRIVDGFAAQGIAADRVEIIGARPPIEEHFALYGRVDIALDTMPYNGTTTTLEALWMGVPVLAVANGDRHAARVGASLLTHAGLGELVARDEDAFVALAARLAADQAARQLYRDTLRGRLARSPLCDAPRFARKLEAAYRLAWQRWCEQA